MRTILVDTDVQFLNTLETVLSRSFPVLKIVARYNQRRQALAEIEMHTPDILFLNIDEPLSREEQAQFSLFSFETIYTASTYDFASLAISNGASGYILKPLRECEVAVAIRYCVHQRLQGQLINGHPKELNHSKEEQLICIPTIG